MKLFIASTLSLMLAVTASPPRAREVTASGVAQLAIDFHTGRVTRVTIARSTRSAVCDKAAVKAFYRAKFKPRTVRRKRIPFTFRLNDSGRS